jgi:hypothetical protein
MKESSENKLIKDFTQRRGLNFRKFYLYPNKIVIETKTIRKIEKYEVNIQYVGLDIFYQADNVLFGKIFTYICLFAPIMLYAIQLLPIQKIMTSNLILLHVFCWLFALFSFLKQHQDDIILRGQTNIEFYRKIPNEQSVLEFIELIKVTTKKYLKSKYYNTDNYIDYKVFNNTMNWLLEQDIISKSEFENIISVYKAKNNIDLNQ